MANVQDVGQLIYDKLGWVDSWKLQKLTYYVQCWGLVWDGDEVFGERFEAWPDGPVSRELHRVNKYHKPAGPWGTDLPNADVGRLTSRQKDVVSAVLAHYGNKTKQELIDLTHGETPWLEARGGIPATARCEDEISVKSMRNAYSIQAICSKEVPAAPAVLQTEPAALSDEAVDREIARWSHTLEWLSVR